MADKLWATSEDGSIHYQLLTSQYMESALELIKNKFCRDENVCRAIGLDQNPEAIAEFAELARNAAKDGVTVLALDIITDKVVGVAFNKLQVKNDDEESFFEKFAKNCKHPESREITKFMIEVDNLCNLFEHCRVNVLLELMFLGTDPTYRKRGIGKTLCEVTVLVAKELNRGFNVKQSIDKHQKLTLDPVPKIVAAMFSSFISQKIGRTLEFDIAARKSYEEFEYRGRVYSEIIGPATPFITLEYKKL